MWSNACWTILKSPEPSAATTISARTLATKRHKTIANCQMPIADLKNGKQAETNWQLAIGNRK
jgi:hypothetical protein